MVEEKYNWTTASTKEIYKLWVEGNKEVIFISKDKDTLAYRQALFGKNNPRLSNMVTHNIIGNIPDSVSVNPFL